MKNPLSHSQQPHPKENSNIPSGRLQNSCALALTHFENNKKRYFDMLADLVSIPSVSFPAFDQNPVLQCAQRTLFWLKESGIKDAELIFINDPHKPYVFAQWLEAGPEAPTYLIYTHYDVQPPGEESKWISPPFQLTINELDGRWYGRGSCDDKGGLVSLLATLDACFKTEGKLPVNLKIIVDGEEESGSKQLNTFLEKYREKIKADAMIIVDTENFEQKIPGITISLRGLVSLQVELKGLDHSLHSGLYGGPLPDPAMALTKMLSTLVDEKGDIAIPEILNMIPKVSKELQNKLKDLPSDEEKFRLESGIMKGVPLFGKPYEIRERMWFRPSFSINAIQASSRAQFSNIIVDSAWARIGLRIVYPMDAEKVFLAIKEHLESHNPWNLQLTITKDSTGEAWMTHTESSIFKSIQVALEKGWGKEAVMVGCGGSIPFVRSFTEGLGGIPALLVGVADPISRAHSENESMCPIVFENTIKSLINFIFSDGSFKN